MSGRRRLSNTNSSFALQSDDDDDDFNDESIIETMNTSSRNGRRSSFGRVSIGKSPSNSSAENNRLAEMYKVVIKMSSENVTISYFI